MRKSGSTRIKFFAWLMTGLILGICWLEDILKSSLTVFVSFVLMVKKKILLTYSSNVILPRLVGISLALHGFLMTLLHEGLVILVETGL